MRSPPDRLAPFAVVFLAACLLAAVAWGSNIPRSSFNSATVQRWCTNNASTIATPIIGLQCAEPVIILTGRKLADAGTKATSDGGEPITPVAGVELVRFPGDMMPIALAPGERCIGVLSADAGANLCTTFDVAIP